MPGSHQPIDVLERLIPIELRLPNRGLIAALLEIGRDDLDVAHVQSSQRFTQRGKALRHQPLAQCSGVVVIRNRQAALRQDRPGVDAWHCLMDGDARLGVAVDDRPVDRFRPAVPRQQRGMNVEPGARRHGQRVRRQDLIEAGHDDHIRPVGAQRADKGLAVGVGGDLDRAAEVPGDPGDQVGLGVGALPAGAADGRHQVDPTLDQVQQEGRAVVRGDAAEDHPKALLVEAGTGIGSARHRLEIDRHHRKLGLRPDAGGEVIEPGIVEGGTPVERPRPHAMDRRTMEGRWSSSP